MAPLLFYVTPQLGRRFPENFKNYRRDLGPAISQIIKPSTGKIRTSRIHSTLLPVPRFDPTIETRAQMSKIKIIKPPTPLISNMTRVLSERAHACGRIRDADGTNCASLTLKT